MGFTEGKIQLDHENGTYYVGETVQGKLVFDLSKEKSFRGIYVNITGVCKVHWTTQHTRRVNDRDETYTKTHESYEEYLNRKIYLIGGAHGEASLNPGHYEFPFTCALPPTLPSSFEGSVGHIRYGIKAVVDRAFKFDQELFMPMNIIAPYDLNTNQHAKEPMEFELYESYCCWCMNYGSSEIVVKVPASGFSVGQTIPIELACTNDSRIEIDTIKFSVHRYIEYRATSEPDTRAEKSKEAELVKGPVPARTTRNWTLEMEVPAITVYNLSACRFIDIQYDFKVEIETSGCHEDSSETHRIYFGTTPIFGPQVISPVENMQNVQAVNSPFPPPITNQPSPYPNRSPYPGNGVPYPGNDVPYPSNGVPYPGPTSSPYPNPTISPYPVNPISPYPVNPPYPNSSPNPELVIPPYPNSSNPAPVPTFPTPQYPPGGNSPYPDTKPPYPGVSPYPAPNPPYPTGASPVPYPTSGPMGFTTNPEVNTTNPSDPFTSASAPPQ